MTNAALPARQPAGTLRDLVFISYSHSDKVWLDRLLIFLKPYTRQNLKIWADPYIKVGDKWRRNISEALSQTYVAVLLVSPEFIDSEFIFQDELPPLLTGADGKVIILVAIPISAADYEAGGLSEFQFAHPPNEPLDKMRTPPAERRARRDRQEDRCSGTKHNALRGVSAVPRPPPSLHRTGRCDWSGRGAPRCSGTAAKFFCGGRNISIS